MTRQEFERAIANRNGRATDWRDNTVKQCYWDERCKCHNLRGYHIPSKDLKFPS